MLFFSRFIGSKRDIAVFQNQGSTGSVAKLMPTSSGKGQVIVVLSDPNYRNLDYAFVDFTVSASYKFEPSTVYMLPFGKIALKVVEGSGTDDQQVCKVYKKYYLQTAE